MLWPGGLLFTRQRMASENPGFFHFRKQFWFLVLPAVLSWPAPSWHQARYRGSHSEGSADNRQASLMGHWLCRHLPLTQGCPVPSQHQHERKSSHPVLRRQTSPKGNKPCTDTTRGQWFWSEAWCCLKTWCSFDLRLLTHLWDFSGAGSGVSPGAAPRPCTWLGCRDREVPPESSIQAAAAVGEDSVQGPGWPGHGAWLWLGIFREAAGSKCAPLAPVQFFASHFHLDRCDSKGKVYFSKSQPRFWKLKGH